MTLLLKLLLFLKGLWLGLVLLLLAPFVLVWRFVHARNMQIWLSSYLRRRKRPHTDGPTHVMFCFVDHYEPMHGRPPLEVQRARVDRQVQQVSPAGRARCGLSTL